ncbi:hypothetical protein [Streptomyces sp. NPDC051219]|uniref:hypothetical protein n=1 Tax=Streptomyces sp. NPDC051219 TaxID=3155283 RepID=UPI00343E312F
MVDAAGRRRADRPDDVQEYVRAAEPWDLPEAAELLVAANIVDITAAALAMMFVRTLTSMQHRKMQRSASAALAV